MNKRYQLPEISITQLIGWTVAVALVVAGFYLMILFHRTLLLLFAAIILSVAIRPIVDWLEERGLPRPLAIVVLFTGVAGLAGLLVWFTVPALADQSGLIVGSLNDGYLMLRNGLEQVPNILSRRLVSLLPEDLSGLSTLALDLGSTISPEPAAEAESETNRALMGLVQAVAMIMLAVGWTLEGRYIKQSALLLVSTRRREAVRETVSDLEGKISSYVLGQAVLSLSIGIMALIGYLLIGLPNAFLLALFAGVMAAVPFLGPFLGAAPAIFIGLSVSPVTVLWVIGVLVVIQQVENNLLVPRVMDRAIGVRPLIGLLSLVAFTSLFGILGALISLPAAAMLQVLLDHFLTSRDQPEETHEHRDHLGVLHYRTSQLVQDVQAQIQAKDQTPSAAGDALEDELQRIALQLQNYLAVKER